MLFRRNKVERERRKNMEGYKFYWMGCKEGTAWVGFLVADKWLKNVLEVKRIDNREIVLRIMVGKKELSLVSV